MADKFSMDDYVDVAERIQNFMDVHPEGSLQTLGWEVCELGGRSFVVYRAAAFRTADDPRPGHGIAWEPFPGRTPYTKDSELMNAETAAWGRAICALGLISNRKLASRQEVRARREDANAEPEPAPDAPDAPAPTPADSAVTDRLRELWQASGWTADKLQWKLVELGVEATTEGIPAAMAALTLEQAVLLAEALGGTLDET